MRNIFKILPILAVIFLIASCSKEDFTGHSKLKPSSPSVSVEGIDPNGYDLVEGGQKFEFTVKLSEPQIADVKLNVFQSEGNATEGLDFTFDHTVVIPAGATSGIVGVSVLADAQKEDDETFTLTIGDHTTSNASFDPVTVTFNIKNYSEGDLLIDMSWNTDALGLLGLDLAPTEAVDMILNVYHADTLFAQADGASFESLTLPASVDDGKYRIAASIFATVNAGDFNKVLPIDIELKFNQLGVINDKVLSFASVMTNEFPCIAYQTFLVDIEKMGTTYSMVENVLTTFSVEPKLESGSYSGTDGHAIFNGSKTVYKANISIQGDTIKGINREWITNVWGEEIQKEGDVIFKINDDGTVVVEEQYIFTTLYEGNEYEYRISGTGYINLCTNTLVLKYTLTAPDGSSPSGWCKNNGYMDTDYFLLNVTFKN